MDFLNKALNQLAELLRSMTPAARITTGLLLLVVLISLGYLFNHPMSGADEFLFNGESISSDQIPAMEGAFAKSNLSGYQIDGGRIRVPRGQRGPYMAALVDNKALPMVIGGPLKNAGGEGSLFGVTKDKREELRRNALQEELMLVMRNMRGIEKASVLIDSQVESGIKSKKTITASVSVKPTGNLPLEEERVPMLRQFVAAAVAGLSPESVAVTDLNTGRTFANSTSAGGGSGLGNSYAEVKRSHERTWEDKIRLALSYIPGVVVTANVELDTEVRHLERSIKYDTKIAATDVEESTSTNTQQSGGGANGGRPGVVANTANAPGAVAATTSSNGNHSQNETSKTITRGLAPVTETNSEKASLTPKYVSATVGVPSSYLEKVWQEKNPAPTGQDAKKMTPADMTQLNTEITGQIQNHVGTLFSTGSETTDKRGQVKVTIFQQLASDPIAAPGIADHALSWLGQSWTTLGMGFLGFFSLIVLRSMVQAPAGSGSVAGPAVSSAAAPTAAASAIEAVPTELAPEESNDEGPKPAAPPRRRRRANTGPTLKDDLVDIVREDPDAAASILRAWIGSGA